MDLTDRQKALLKAIIEEYIESAQPIGSEIVERKYNLGVSPATIRNEMVRLTDVLAMIDGDSARWGYFLVGICQTIDVNKANQDVIAAMARGVKKGCTEGQCALLNGETAELGYRVAGYGRNRVNWAATGVSLYVPNKFISGMELRPGQPIVALEDPSGRSNGFTERKDILKKGYLYNRLFPSMWPGTKNPNYGLIRSAATTYLQVLVSQGKIQQALNDGLPEMHQTVKEMIGSFNDKIADLLDNDKPDQLLIPWHLYYPDIAQAIAEPTIFYGKLIHEAQGWIDGEKQVDITGTAHITGGGIPEKVSRMLSITGLGAHIDPVFPEPKSISSVLEVSDTLPEGWQINDRKACEVWHRGIGFIVATKTDADARRMVEIADNLGYNAAIAGEIIEEPKIEFRSHTWTY